MAKLYKASINNINVLCMYSNVDGGNKVISTDYPFVNKRYQAAGRRSGG